MTNIKSVIAALALVGVSVGMASPAFAKHAKKACDASGVVCKAGAKDCSPSNCKPAAPAPSHKKNKPSSKATNPTAKASSHTTK